MYNPYDVLTRRTVVYLLPCYDFSPSEHLEPISDVPVTAQQFVLFVALVVYVYRDIWPLATYVENPVDGFEGALAYSGQNWLFYSQPP